jgi:hypothetical protein
MPGLHTRARRNRTTIPHNLARMGDIHMRLLLGCSVLVVFSTFDANRQTNQEQQQTITIGDTELALGMSEELVSKKLGERLRFIVSKQDAPEGLRAKGITSTWILDEKAAQSTRPSLATVAFMSGKLAYVRKTLLRQDGGHDKLAEQLFLAMRDLERQGNSPCSFETREGQLTNFVERTAKLRSGKKAIILDLQKIQNSGEIVQLNEELSNSSER